MKKILIIGSSYSIKDTFSKIFKFESVSFLNFREAWNKRNIKSYDLIILSGFHHMIIKKNITDLKNYVKEYFDFILFLENKCNTIVLVSTFIPSKFCFSKTVFFYRNILRLALYRDKIKIISFKKIIIEKHKNKIFFKILKFFGLKFTNQINLLKNIEDYYMMKIPKPLFLFLNIKRNMFIERFLRIFDYS